MKNYSFYMFDVGDCHSAVTIIRQFLNAHPQVSQSNLPLTNAFDWQTSTALAEYQRHKSLSIKNGAMNFETYLAMGRDMGAAEIRKIAGLNPTFVTLLTTPANQIDVQAIVDNTVYVSGRGGEAETPAHIQKIKNQLKKIITCDKCRQAYMDAGLPDPLKFLENSVRQKSETDDARQAGTYTVTSCKGLEFDDIARGFRVSDEDRKVLLGGKASATTIGNAADGITGGITFIRPSAFLDPNYSSEEIVSHELIHGMGKKGQRYSTEILSASGLSVEKRLSLYVIGVFIEGLATHDLKYMGNDYSKIMEACTK